VRKEIKKQRLAGTERERERERHDAACNPILETCLLAFLLKQHDPFFDTLLSSLFIILNQSKLPAKHLGMSGSGRCEITTISLDDENGDCDD